MSALQSPPITAPPGSGIGQPVATNAVLLEAVTKRYGSGHNAVTALDELTLALPRARSPR